MLHRFLSATAIGLVGLAAAGCNGSDSSTSGSTSASGSGGAGGTGSSGSNGSTSGSSTTSSASGSGQGGTGTASSTASTGSGSGTGGSSAGDIPGGGTILFEEPFEDTNYASRGWYDGPSGTLDTNEHVTGSTQAFECAFQTGATSCTGGKPARHKFPASPTVYLGFHIKFGANWVGSGMPYHPHMFHFINDRDGDYIGPAHSYLTTYTEVVGGRALLALQDSKNVDLNCLLRNNDTFVGCNGDFNTYPFTEDRSACSCNGLAGDLDGRDCFPNGNGTWYSSRSWGSDNAFQDTPGPNYKNDWHFVEAYFEMNSIQGNVGVPDGKIRWVQDGQVLISYDHILMRTNANATMQFNQFAMLPYIGDGSPLNQSFWVDNLTVATARP